MEAKDYLTLKPGRMIFNSVAQTLRVVERIEGNKIIFVDGTYFHVTMLRKDHMQIIPEGPFDGRKLYPGYWVWVESKRDDVVQGWQQIVKIDHILKGVEVIPAKPCGNRIFAFSGISYGLNGSTMHYYPPKEVSYKKNPEFLAHVADVLLDVKKGNMTCPIRGTNLDGRCNAGGRTFGAYSPVKGSLCFYLYGDSVKRCPCYALGETKVRRDLIKFVLEYFDVEVKDD